MIAIVVPQQVRFSYLNFLSPGDGIAVRLYVRFFRRSMIYFHHATPQQMVSRHRQAA